MLNEVLHRIFHYEPYAGFSKDVQNKVDASIVKFRTKKVKASVWNEPVQVNLVYDATDLL